jgi:DNA-binding LytR/AlgR family response regulator
MSCIFVRSDYRMYKIEFARIRYIEASKNYCKIHTTDKVHLILTTLNIVMATLPANEFCRIHRSFIVSIAYLESFDKQAAYLSDCNLPIGATYLGLLEQHVTILGNPPDRQHPAEHPPAQPAGRPPRRMVTSQKERSVDTDLR